MPTSEYYDNLFEHVTSHIVEYFEEEDIALSQNGFSKPDDWRKYVLKIIQKLRQFLQQREAIITVNDFDEHTRYYVTHYIDTLDWNFKHVINRSLSVLSKQPRALMEAQLQLISEDILRKRGYGQIMPSCLMSDQFVEEANYYLWCEMEGILLKKLARPIFQENIEHEEVEQIENIPWKGTLEELNTVRDGLHEKGFILDADNFINHFSVNGDSDSATSKGSSSPIIWQGTTAQLAYFLSESQNKRKIAQHVYIWVLAKMHFLDENNQPVKNLRQTHNNNKNNKSGKPLGSDKIDAVLEGL